MRILPGRVWFLPTLVFLASVFIRLLVIHISGASEIQFGDARDYLDTAHFICQENSYPERGNLPFFRAPGLPVFICAVTMCNVENVALIKTALAVVDSLTVLAIWGIARVLSKRPSVPFFASVLAAVNPLFVFQTAGIRSEPLFMALITGAFLFFLFAHYHHRKVFLPVVGVLLGFAALSRPVGLVAIPFLAIVWFLGEKTEPWHMKTAGAVVMLVGAACVLAPWVWFMYLRHGELILVNDAGGYNLWRGSHPELIQALKAKDVEEYRALATHFETVTSPAEAGIVAREATSPLGRSRAWRQRAIAYAIANPRQYGRDFAWKMLQYWRPWLNPLEHSRVRVLASTFEILILYTLGAIGLFCLRKGDRWAFWFIVFWFGLGWIATSPFQVVMRFRIPFTDPFLLVLAALAISSFPPWHSARQKMIAADTIWFE